MPTLSEISRFLDKELKIRSFKEYSKNGIQVNACKEITKIGFAVDASLATFLKAKHHKCNLIITHHGIIWRGKQDLLKRQRINFLKKNKISLYTAHQPLDIHDKYGNNIMMAKYLNLSNIKKFGRDSSGYWGYEGTVSKTSLSSVINLLNSLFKKNHRSSCLRFGKKQVQRLGIVSGSGSFALEEAKKKDIDTIITGEIKHSTYHEAKELGLNIISAGHYYTETLGVKSLQLLLRTKYKVKTIFIDLPTGM